MTCLYSITGYIDSEIDFEYEVFNLLLVPRTPSFVCPYDELLAQR